MSFHRQHDRSHPIGIAGSGNMARTIGRLLREKGDEIVAVASRDIAHAAAAAHFIGGKVAGARLEELPQCASRILIAVPDDALAEVAEKLAESGFRQGIALHTCGARGPEALAALSREGVSCGALHPLQTVSSPQQGLEALKGISFAIDGDEAALGWAEEIVDFLGGRALRILPEARPLYHAAAVMASNNLIGVLDAALTLMRMAGVDEESSRRALGPLVRVSAENVMDWGAEAALTGPVARGDVETVRSHLAALAAAPQAVRDLYLAAGIQLVAIGRKRGQPAEVSARLEALLKGLENQNA